MRFHSKRSNTLLTVNYLSVTPDIDPIHSFVIDSDPYFTELYYIMMKNVIFKKKKELTEIWYDFSNYRAFHLSQTETPCCDVSMTELQGRGISGAFSVLPLSSR